MFMLCYVMLVLVYYIYVMLLFIYIIIYVHSTRILLAHKECFLPFIKV